MGELKWKSGIIELFDSANDRTKYMQVGPNATLQILDSDGKLDQEFGDLGSVKSVKRAVAGDVVFAGTGTSRGTNTTTSGLTTGSDNPAVTVADRANFVKAVAKIGAVAGTPTGTLALKVLDGTTTLTSVTTGPGVKTFTTTAENVNVLSPQVVLDISGLGKGTLNTVTVTESLNEYATPQVPLN